MSTQFRPLRRQERKDYECGMTIPVGREGSFARDVMEQFAERLAERQDFSEVVGGEVGA